MPFNYDYYRPQFTREIGELLRAPYDSKARIAAVKGEISARNAQLWPTLVNQLGSTLGDVLQYKADAPVRAAQTAHLQAQAANDEATVLARQKEVSDLALEERAYGPYALQAPGFEGPLEATSPMPTRDQTLAALPVPLREKALKRFEAADEAALRLKDLRDKTDLADVDYAGRLGAGIADFGYSPEAARLAIDHAKETYQTDPARLKKIEEYEQQIFGPSSQQPYGESLGAALQPGAQPQSQDEQRAELQQRIKQATDALIDRSPEQRKLKQEQAGSSDYQRALARYERELGRPVTSVEEVDFRRKFGTDAAPPVRGGTIEDAMATWAREHNTTPDKMTFADKMAVRKQFEGAGREDAGFSADELASYVSTVMQNPSVYADLTATVKTALAPKLAAAGFTEFRTPANIGAAERWKQNALSALEKEKREGVGPYKMSDEDYKAAKDRIEESYKLQTGGGTLANQVTRTEVRIPTTIPTDVDDFFKDKGAGIVKFDDGTTWQKTANGQIQQITAK